MILASYIVYIPTILFFVMLLGAVLTGLRRGFRKSLILFINAMIALVVAGVIFAIIFAGKFDERIIVLGDKFLPMFGTSFKDLLGTSNSYDTLSEYLRELVMENMSDEFLSSHNVLTIISLCMAAVESILKLVILLVLIIVYWVIKFILYIFYLIFFREGRKKKKINKRFKQGLVARKYNKRPLLGMGVGFARGLLFTMLTFSFLGSFFYVLTGGNYSDEDSNVVINVDGKDYEISEYVDIVNRYGSVGIGKVFEAVRDSNDVPLYLLAADFLTSGNYIIEGEDGEVIEGTLHGREEIGPIIGFVKDVALLALEYDIDLDRIQNDTDYFGYFFSKENVKNGVSFIDKMSTIVDRLTFGQYTLYLGQCFLSAVADSFVPAEVEEDDFAGQLLYTLFRGENRIKPEDVVNNDNIKSIVKTALVVLENSDELKDFAQRFNNEEGQAKQRYVFGITKNMKDTSSSDAIKSVINSVDNMISNFSFLNSEKSDALISDIIISLVGKLLPEFSLDGVDDVNDPCSIYKIHWKNTLSEIFDIACNFVDFIIEDEIIETDTLIDKLIHSVGESGTPANNILYSIIGSDFSGVFLNSKGFVDMVNSALESSNISLPTNVIYGNYYDSEGQLVYGEVYRLIDTLSDKIGPVYDVVTNKDLTTSQLVSNLLDSELGLIDKVSSLVDTNKVSNYSFLLHSMLSDLLIGFDFGDSIRVYVPSSVKLNIEDNLLISSNELINLFDVAQSLSDEISQLIGGEEINYSQLLTTENLNLLLTSEILKATVSIVAYDTISQNEQFGQLVPQSLYLDTDENIEKNIDSWVGDNGELKCIVDALDGTSLLDTLLNGNDFEIKSIIDEIEPTNIKRGMESNLLNIIVTDIIKSTKIEDVEIQIPQEAKLEQLDGLDRIKPNEMELAFKVIKGIDIVSLLDQEELDISIVLEKILSMDTDTQQNCVDSNIMNATITSLMNEITVIQGESTFNLKLPKSSIMRNKSQLMLEFDAFNKLLDAFNSIFDENSDGTKNYDVENINYNRLFEDDVITRLCDSVILHATIASVMSELIYENGGVTYVTVPQGFKDADFDYFEQSIWIENSDLQQSELRYLIESLKAMGISFKDDGTLEIYEEQILQLSLTANEEDSSLNTVLKSKIFKYSITNQIQKNGFVIVDAIRERLYDDINAEYVIKDDEIKKLFVSIVDIYGDAKIEAGLTFKELKSGITIDSLKNKGLLTWDKLEGLLDSVVVETKIAELIVKKENTVITIPNQINFIKSSVSGDYETEDVIYQWLSIDKYGDFKTNSKGEIRKILKALDILDLLDTILSTSQDFSVTKFTQLQSEELTEVLSSDVIHASCINKFYEKISSNDQVYLPKGYEAVNQAEISENYYSLPIVKEMEMVKIIDAIKQIDLDLENINVDVNTILSLNEKAIINGEESDSLTKLSMIYRSSIIWYTISMHINNATEINVPTYEIIEPRNVLYQYEQYLQMSSVAELIDAINYLGITDINSGFNTDKILSYDVNELVKSQIIWYTLSHKVNRIDALSHPDTMCNEEVIVNDSPQTIIQYDYLTKAELVALFNSFTLLGIDKTEEEIDADNVFNTVRLSSNENLMSEICQSYIIWLTISDCITDMETIDKPYIAYDFTISQTQKYITKDELQNVVDATNILGLSTLSTFDINNFLSVGDNAALWDSYIVRYTTTNSIVNTEELIITSDIMETLQEQYFITILELTNFMGAIKSLNLTDLSAVDVSLTVALAHSTKLLQSTILHATMSEELFKANQKVVLDSTHVLTTTRHNSTAYYYVISKNDIQVYLQCANDLGLTEYGEDINIYSVDTIVTLKESHIFCTTYDEDINKLITRYNAFTLIDTSYSSVTITTSACQTITYSDGVVSISSEEILNSATIEEFVQNAQGWVYS